MALLFTAGRQTGRNVLPLNQQTGYESPKVLAVQMRRRGIRVIAVGCCNADENELREIAGESEYTFMARSAQELEGKVDEILRKARTGGGFKFVET